jgi:hypothetical protein
MDFLFAAHSGLRFLVLLAGALAAVYLLFGWLTSRPFDAPARMLSASFVGLLDLQVLLGLGVLLTRPFYPALAGHLGMMIGAAVAAHGLGVVGKRADDPRKRYLSVLGGVVLALLLIAGGILSIGRGLFQSTIG